MVYRPTSHTEARKADARARIVHAARQLISERGFMETQISHVAAAAGVATGTVYRHFPAKADLFAEVFRQASMREVEVMAEVAAQSGPARDRLTDTIRVFAQRALQAPRMAWSLIAEPVDATLDIERLALRQAYAQVLVQLIDEAVQQGDVPRQMTSVTAACLVGALAEALVGPLAPDQAEMDAASRGALAHELVALCLRAVGYHTD
ncbi:TetR/AcrR family transcriptional regulator [Chitinivorax sp. B]|uniref:TetR/AcrR family transcriptional regulator n=1 Tax=Chitinivorax sp. B TaxID=2502235 RepID=UPI0010F8B8E0|nr:TetR/AcrR family transcriptional regulator [Chitinivorax sp. B]